MRATLARPGLTFRVRRWYPTAREKVFQAWTTPEALRAWWCPPGWAPTEVDVELRVDGPYRIGMQKHSNGLHVAVCGRFLEVRAPERLVYTWQWENAFPGLPETIVTVEFVACGTGTQIVLQHGSLPEATVCLQHRAGWIAALERLEPASKKAA